MDPLVSFARRHRRPLILAAGAAAATVYLYNTRTVTLLRGSIARLCAASVAAADATSAVLEATAVISSDVSSYLLSDSDEVPKSVRQLSKLAASDEAAAAASCLSKSFSAGVIRGCYSASSESSGGSADAEANDFSTRLLETLFSPAGADFVSQVASSVASSAVSSYLNYPTKDADPASSAVSWVAIIAREPCKDAIADWVRAFVETAVAVFIEKTIHINTYDQLFAGLTNPEHESRVREMLVSVCNNAVDTLIKSSHKVLTKENDRSVGADEQKHDRGETSELRKREQISGNSSVRCVQTVSSTLALPSNRRFVLDVTGRVTFETVRSILEFVLWTMYDGARRWAELLHQKAAEQSIQMVNYISKRPVLIASICISLCLHVWYTRVQTEYTLDR